MWRERIMRNQVVLLVDQDASVAEAIALGLGSGHFSFLFAQDFQEAVRILGEHGKELSLVITDIEPRGPGLALLVAIKTYRQDLPVIVLTSVTDPSLSEEARRRGAARLLRQPIDFVELRMVIRSIYEEEGSLPDPAPPVTADLQSEPAAEKVGHSTEP
jgi:DNA-binding NtrC family response regulator